MGFRLDMWFTDLQTYLGIIELFERENSTPHLVGQAWLSHACCVAAPLRR